MKWLRVWFESDEDESVQTGIVIGISDETWLMVRLDSGLMTTLNHSYVKTSKWVKDPEKKVKQP